MNRTLTLKRLCAVAGAGCLVLALAAQMPPAARGVQTAADSGKKTAIELCRPDAGPLPVGGPLQSIHAHVCGFHFYGGDLRRALRADHYCSHLNPEVFQCIIYDSDQATARLIGVEYIISERLFLLLPEEEKKLWHSHRYEVMSGQLVAPGLPDAAEEALMEEFVGTYGKTWYLWQVDRGDTLPLGLPKLMMGFTADGQADAKMVADRDHDLKIDSAKVKARRVNLPTRPVAAGADGWEHGQTFQINDMLVKQNTVSPQP